MLISPKSKGNERFKIDMLSWNYFPLFSIISTVNVLIWIIFSMLWVCYLILKTLIDGSAHTLINCVHFNCVNLRIKDLIGLPHGVFHAPSLKALIWFTGVLFLFIIIADTLQRMPLSILYNSYSTFILQLSKGTFPLSPNSTLNLCMVWPKLEFIFWVNLW